MEWFIPLEISQLIIAFLFTILFFFLFIHDRKNYLFVWGLGLGAWSVKYIIEIISFLNGDLVIYHILDLFCWIYGAIFIAKGTFELANKKVPNWIVYGSLLSGLWILLSSFIGAQAIYQEGLIFIFGGVVFLLTGIILIRELKYKIIGKYFTGWGFILWGFHFADFPFLREIEWIAPIGYVIAIILAFLTINGLLIIYHQIIKQDLAKSEERFRFLAEHALDLIYRYKIHPQFETEYISPSAKKITGYSIEEFYEIPDLYMKLIYPEDKPFLDNFLETLHEDESTITLRWVRKDGEIIWVEQKNTSVYDKSGKLIAIEGIVRDITERKIVEQNVLKIDKSRRYLLSSISHELQTPMTSIQGYLEAILDQVIKDEREIKKYLELIHHRVIGVNRIITDLFELSSLESKQLTFKFTLIRIKELLDLMYHKCKMEIQSSGLQLILNVKKELENKPNLHENILVSVDIDRMNQVFLNLFNNAIKNTPDGGKIEVGLKLKEETNEVFISIKDNGAGIPKDDLPHIFERFYKSRNKRDYRGSGLGLTISKEIIDVHGGRIWAESEEGIGTTFFITLPIHTKD